MTTSLQVRGVGYLRSTVRDKSRAKVPIFRGIRRTGSAAGRPGGRAGLRVVARARESAGLP